MTRDELLARLTVERYQPTPPHRVLPAEPPPPPATGGPDTPGRVADRRRVLTGEEAT